MDTIRTRKWHVLVIALSIIVLIPSCAKSPDNQLVGEWMGTDPTGDTASFLFNEDGTARMIQGNMVLDGSSIGGTVTWKLDASHDPMHLDLVMSKESGETVVLPMIIRFLGENRLQAKISEDRQSRPLEFSESTDINQVVLTRQ